MYIWEDSIIDLSIKCVQCHCYSAWYSILPNSERSNQSSCPLSCLCNLRQAGSSSILLWSRLNLEKVKDGESRGRLVLLVKSSHMWWSCDQYVLYSQLIRQDFCQWAYLGALCTWMVKKVCWLADHTVRESHWIFLQCLLLAHLLRYSGQWKLRIAKLSCTLCLSCTFLCLFW